MKMWLVLGTSFGVLLRILLRTTDGILNLLFDLGCCRAAVIGSGIFQFSQAQVFVFLLEAFLEFSFLAHFEITSLVVFAELSILLCYEVFV